MPYVARIGDLHTCPATNEGTSHVGGPVTTGSSTVTANRIPVARVGDTTTCHGPVDPIVEGSTTVFVDYRPVARVGDHTAHGGVIVDGDQSVIIG